MGGESEDAGTMQEATEQCRRAVMGQGREGGWAGGRREVVRQYEMDARSTLLGVELTGYADGFNVGKWPGWKRKKSRTV